MLGCKYSRWDSANRAVGSYFVVVLTPDGDDLAGLSQGFEPVLVEAFIPELAVEAFDVSVLRGLAWLDQDVLNASRLHPCHEGSACELRTVVGSDGLWVAPEPCGLIQDAGDVCAWHGQVHSNVDAFMREVICDGQAFDASPVGQRITDEVQAQGLIDSCGGHQRCSLTTVLLALVALAYSQTLRTIEPEHLLVVGARKLGAQHVVHAAVPKAPSLHGDGMDALTQTHRVRIGLRRMSPSIARQPHKTTSPALGYLGVLQHPGNGLALVLRG